MSPQDVAHLIGERVMGSLSGVVTKAKKRRTRRLKMKAAKSDEDVPQLVPIADSSDSVRTKVGRKKKSKKQTDLDRDEGSLHSDGDEEFAQFVMGNWADEVDAAEAVSLGEFICGVTAIDEDIPGGKIVSRFTPRDKDGVPVGREQLLYRCTWCPDDGIAGDYVYPAGGLRLHHKRNCHVERLMPPSGVQAPRTVLNPEAVAFEPSH